LKSAEVGSDDLESGNGDSTDDGSTEVGSAQDSFIEVGSAQGSSIEVGSAEVWLYFVVLSSPCVPGVNSLSKQIKLLLVCHRASLLRGAHIIEGRTLICKNSSFFLFHGDQGASL